MRVLKTDCVATQDPLCLISGSFVMVSKGYKHICKQKEPEMC